MSRTSQQKEKIKAETKSDRREDISSTQFPKRGEFPGGKCYYN